MTRDAPNKIEKMRARNAALNRLSADNFVEITLGKYTHWAISAGEPLSRAGLRAWVQGQQAKTLSAKGELQAEQDLMAQWLEGVLRFLDAAPPEVTATR